MPHRAHATQRPSVATWARGSRLAAIRQVLPQGWRPVRSRPRVPPSARVAFTGGSRGCVASHTIAADVPACERGCLAAIRQLMHHRRRRSGPLRRRDAGMGRYRWPPGRDQAGDGPIGTHATERPGVATRSRGGVADDRHPPESRPRGKSASLPQPMSASQRWPRGSRRRAVPALLSPHPASERPPHAFFRRVSGSLREPERDFPVRYREPESGS